MNIVISLMIGCEQTTFENPVKWKVLFRIINFSVSNSFEKRDQRDTIEIKKKKF
jgi:hypothetical protein